MHSKGLIAGYHAAYNTFWFQSLFEVLRFPAVTGPHRIGWENSKPTKLALKPCPENKRAVKYKVLLKFDLLLPLSITS